MKKVFHLYISAYSGLPARSWMLALIILINRSGSMVLFFLSLYLTSELHYTISEAGKLISIYGVGALIGTYVGGIFSDLYGTSRVQFWSLVLSGFGFIILGNLHSISSISIMLLLLAIAAESFRPASATAMAQICPASIRPRGFALMRLAVNLGFTIGPAIGGFIANINYTYLFWIDGLTCIAAAISFWFVFYKKEMNRKAVAEQYIRIKKSFWKDSVFINILSIAFIIGIVIFQIFNCWPLYLKQDYKLLEYQIGSLMAINTILIVLFEMPVIHKLEKINPLKIMRLGSVFFFSGFFLMQFGNSYSYAAFTIIIWTIGEILILPMCASFIANLATESNIGKYMGLYTFTFSFSFVVGPASSAWIYENIHPSALWSIIGILGIFVWIRFFFLEKKYAFNYNKSDF